MVYTQGSNGLGKLDVSSSQVSSILKVRSYLQNTVSVSNPHRPNLGPMCSSLSPWVYPSFPLHQPSGPCRLCLARRSYQFRYSLEVGLYLQCWFEALPARCRIPGIISMDVASIWYVFSASWITSNSVQVAFWIYADAINITTDLLIIALTLGILVHLQMPIGRKLMVIGVFGSRIV